MQMGVKVTESNRNNFCGIVFLGLGVLVLTDRKKEPKLCLGSILYCFKTLSFTIQSLLLHVWSDASFTNETRAQSVSSLHINNLWWWEVCADKFRSDSSIDFPFQTNKSICFSFLFLIFLKVHLKDFQELSPPHAAQGHTGLSVSDKQHILHFQLRHLSA